MLKAGLFQASNKMLAISLSISVGDSIIVFSEDEELDQ
jgi:hypothetical protein